MRRPEQGLRHAAGAEAAGCWAAQTARWSTRSPSAALQATRHLATISSRARASRVHRCISCRTRYSRLLTHLSRVSLSLSLPSRVCLVLAG